MLQKQADLTLVNRIGKLEVKQSSDSTGLYDIIKLNAKLKNQQAPINVAFDLEGGAFACLDKGGNGTMYYSNKNRYVHFTTQAHGTHLAFIQKGNGQLAVALKNNNIALYNNLNGKLLNTLKWHTFHIEDLQVNHLRNMLMSVSQDCCALWNLNNLTRTKTLFGKAGKFVSAVFSPNGCQLITLFQDGCVYFWNMDTFETESKAQLASNSGKNMKIQCSLESDYVAVGGQQNSLHVCQIRDKSESFQFEQYQLPPGCCGIKQMKFFKNGCLCFVGSDQTFYVTQPCNGNIQLLKFNLPGGRGIIDFDINIRAETLLAVASTGEMFLYDLPKLIGAQQTFEDRKIAAGVSEDLVKTKLIKSNNRQMVLSSPYGQGTKQSSDYDNQENLILESKEGDEIDKHKTYEEAYVVQQGQPRQVLLQNTLNQPQQYKDTNKIEKMYKSSQIKIGDTSMDYGKLRSFLKRFQLYPDKHRPLIYKYLLKLPMNFECFDNLVTKGLHEAFVNLNQNYPIESPKLYTKMQRILSALAHYCSAFAEIDFIPAIIFPFVKLFGVDECLCFEVILSFFIHWGQHLFEFYPNPPIAMLQAVEDILKQYDQPLQQHLRDCDFGLNNYMWPPLQVLFTDMLCRKDWICFADFLMSYPDQPELLLYFVASFFIHFRDPLLKIRTPEELDIFLHKQASLKIQPILDRALKMCRSGSKNDLMIVFKHNLPLTNNQYPIFNFYPQFTIDHHAKLRQQIQEEERQIQQRQNQIIQLNNLTQNMQKLEDRLRDREEHLLRAEKDRRDFILYEDEIRMAKNVQMEQNFRDQKLKHLTQMEKSMREGVDRQKKLRDIELENVQEEILARKKFDNQFMQSKMEEEAIQNLEYKSAARMNELIDLRAREERQRRNRIDMDYKQKQHGLHTQLLEQRHLAEDEEARLRRELLKQQKSLQVYEVAENNDRRAFQNSIAEQEFLRDLKLQEIERERKLRQISEQDTFHQQEIQRLKQQQKEILIKEDEKHIQALLAKERDSQLQYANERLKILDIEKRRQQEELDTHYERLQAISNIQNRQELEQKIQDMRRQAQEAHQVQEEQLQKMILDIEEQKRVQGALMNELDEKELQYLEQENYHNDLRQQEDRAIQDERSRFNEFREQVKNELDYREDEGLNQPYQQATLGKRSSLKPSPLYNRERSRDDELLDKIAQTRAHIYQQQEVDKQQDQEENYRIPQSSYQNQGGQRMMQPSVRFSGPNTQSLYSYSASDESKQRRSPYKSLNQPQQIYNVDRPYQYSSSGKKDEIPQRSNQYSSFDPRSLSSSEQSRPQKEDFNRYRPQQHYEESDEASSSRYDNYQPGLEGSQLTYSSGPSTAQKPQQQQGDDQQMQRRY